MITFLIIVGCFFGLGAIIGAVYATVRYVIPTIITGIIGIFAGAREGWIQGSEDTERILAARATRKARE